MGDGSGGQIRLGTPFFRCFFPDPSKKWCGHGFPPPGQPPSIRLQGLRTVRGGPPGGGETVQELLRPARPARPPPLGDRQGKDPADGRASLADLPGGRAYLFRPDRLRDLLGDPPSPEPRPRPQRLVRDHLRARVPPAGGGCDLVDGLGRREPGTAGAGGTLRRGVPRRYPGPGLHRARPDGPAARGAGAGPRQASVRRLLRQGLHPPVRAEMRPERVRRADLHHGDQAVRGGPGIRVGDPSVVGSVGRGSRTEGGGRRRRSVGTLRGEHALPARGPRHRVRPERGARRDDAVRRDGVPVPPGGAALGREVDLRPRGPLPRRKDVRQGRDLFLACARRVRRRAGRRRHSGIRPASRSGERRSRGSTTPCRFFRGSESAGPRTCTGGSS